ncbi:MAG: endonuclease MutS2 [Clostridia bacterium]|nr:endonuclease MutS2 [Clostridia bacterium]
MIDTKTLNALEYGKVMKELSRYCCGREAAVRVIESCPAASYEDAVYMLEQTREADKLLYEHCVSPDVGYESVSDCLEMARKMSILSIPQIKAVGDALHTARVARSAICGVNDDSIEIIREIAEDISVDGYLERSISESIVGDSELSDNASNELRHLRSAVRQASEAVRAKLNSYLVAGKSKYLQDAIITVRSGRYVLPVKAECRSSVAGLLHDRSASGATVYIEPYAVVELNNDVKSLQAQAEEEERRILAALTAQIRAQSDNIEDACDRLSRLDAILAKAKYAKAVKAVMPILNNKGYINIVGGRHPLLDVKTAVPVSLALGGEYSVMIISGPNTGGKTVSLKMCGLLTLMASSGMYVPCTEGSELSYFGSVYCDIGDLQSIERNLSTFSSHMSNVAEILERADGGSLVLLDEIGGGTDPQEGSALAVACIEYLLKAGCKCIATSHYDELKAFSAQTGGISNASMDFDPTTYKPTYRLVTGVAGASNALETAAALGLPKSVTERAISLISPDKIRLNALLSGAEKALREAEENLAEARRYRQESEARAREAQAERDRCESVRARLEEKMRKGYKELLSDYTEQAEELVEQIRQKVKEGDEKALFEARRLKNELARGERAPIAGSNEIKKEGGEISVGDDVYVKSLAKRAKVCSYNAKKREYKVKAGVMTAMVSADDIYKIKASNKGEVIIKRTIGEDGAPSRHVSAEIDLRGQTCDEAIYNLDAYIEDALRAGYPEITVVHGKGSGALRVAVRKALGAHSAILEYREGKYGEGDSGVTVARLQ